MKKAVDDETWDVTADHVMVLRNAGPQGGPGMPEWGMLPMPKALLKQGHRDMLRMSDARMSGTSYGACILHVAPEAYIGGPLALLRTGDIVTLDVDARTIRMEVPTRSWRPAAPPGRPPPPRFERGYGFMFTKHIQQADQGCDFDFLRTEFGAPGPRAGDLLSGDGEHAGRHKRASCSASAPLRWPRRCSSAGCATR